MDGFVYRGEEGEFYDSDGNVIGDYQAYIKKCKELEDEKQKHTELQIDLAETQRHDFFDSLNKEQLIVLNFLLSTPLALGPNVSYKYIGEISAYLRIKFDMCAPLNAQAGEKVSLHGGMNDLEDMLQNMIDNEFTSDEGENNEQE